MNAAVANTKKGNKMNAASQQTMNLARPNGRPAAPSKPIRISVRFAPAEPVHFQIKQLMKTSQDYSMNPALFRIAAFIENAAVPNYFVSAPVVTEAAFARLRSEAAKPKTKESNNGHAVNAPGGGTSKPRAARTAPAKNRVMRKSSSDSLRELKRTEFHLEAPFAESVKLAADFTDWEKFPLDLIKSEDGIWYTTVPLPPGNYSYRFIVDGRWCDDPRPNQHAPNPFGTVNAVVEVR